MSIEPIVAKIAFVRGLLDREKCKDRDRCIFEENQPIGFVKVFPLDKGKRIVTQFTSKHNLSDGIWNLEFKSMNPLPAGGKGAPPPNKSCKLNQSFAPFIKAPSNSKEARRMIKSGSIKVISHTLSFPVRSLDQLELYLKHHPI